MPDPGQSPRYGLARIRVPFAPVALIGVVLVLGLLVAGRGATGEERIGFAQTAPTAGVSRANPVPPGQEAVAGPLRIMVTDVRAGVGAVDQVLAASPNNAPPAAGDTYVLSYVTVRNAGESSVFVSNDDFGLTGSSGVIRRFLTAVPPSPALFGEIEPGATMEGWLVFAAPPDETNLLLVFDSLSLEGTWSDVTMMLLAGATIADAGTPSARVNDAGRDPAQPARLNEPVVAGDWDVELVAVVFGAEVFDLVDYRTGALGAEDASNDTPWLALRFRVTNTGTGGAAAHFPANAFRLADATGALLPDAVTLTPPVPDASGDYYPGASREGWVAFELPSYDPHLIILDPYGTMLPEPDPRYISYE